MMLSVLAAFAPIAHAGLLQAACVPAPPDPAKPTPSSIDDHRVLRGELNEPMPDASVMVMLYGNGGHLASQEYSIVVARSDDGRWRGTANGRSRIRVEGAPYTPKRRVEWTLDDDAGRRLDAALTRCRTGRRPVDKRDPSEPPPRNFVAEKVDIVREGRPISTFYVGEDGEGVSAMIRPPGG